MKRLLAATASLLLLTACSTPGGRGEPPAPGHYGGPGGDAGGAVATTPADDLQQRLAGTAAALRLTPRQQVLWQAYRAQVGALMADQMRAGARAAKGGTAMRQIGRRVDTVRNRLAAMEEVALAARSLYDSLDEAQRAVADQKLPATVPALYSGIVAAAGAARRQGPRGGRGGPGGPGGPPRRFAG